MKAKLKTLPQAMTLRTKLLAQAKSKQSLRTTIPWQVRDELGLKDGDTVEWGVTSFDEGGKAAWVRRVEDV